MARGNDHLLIPEGYKPSMSIKETEVAIKHIKDLFEDTLAGVMNLTRYPLRFSSDRKPV